MRVLGAGAGYLERLGIEDCVVGGKKVMFRVDFLTVRNITMAIYQSQMEIHPIDRFEFIEPIAGFLHLQMNVLKLFLGGVYHSLRVRSHLRTRNCRQRAHTAEGDGL